MKTVLFTRTGIVASLLFLLVAGFSVLGIIIKSPEYFCYSIICLAALLIFLAFTALAELRQLAKPLQVIIEAVAKADKRWETSSQARSNIIRAQTRLQASMDRAVSKMSDVSGPEHFDQLKKQILKAEHSTSRDIRSLMDTFVSASANADGSNFTNQGKEQSSLFDLYLAVRLANSEAGSLSEESLEVCRELDETLARLIPHGDILLDGELAVLAGALTPLVPADNPGIESPAGQTADASTNTAEMFRVVNADKGTGRIFLIAYSSRREDMERVGYHRVLGASKSKFLTVFSAATTLHDGKDETLAE